MQLLSKALCCKPSERLFLETEYVIASVQYSQASDVLFCIMALKPIDSRVFLMSFLEPISLKIRSCELKNVSEAT